MATTSQSTSPKPARAKATIDGLPLEGMGLGGAAGAELEVEAIVKLLKGSKSERFTLLDVTAEAKIRDIVRAHVVRKQPIPAVSVCAPCKLPDFDVKLDMAEFKMLEALHALAGRVRDVYPPGLTIRLRIEDLTVLCGMADVATDAAHCRRLSECISEYVSTLRALNKKFHFDGCITLVTESELAIVDEFAAKVTAYAPIFRTYLLETDDNTPDQHEQSESFAQLEQHGWLGGISKAQRDFLNGQLLKLYGTEAALMLARYFGAILARRQLKAEGPLPAWSQLGFVKIGLSPPMPDCPPTLPAIYVKVVPCKDGATSVWRSTMVAKCTRARDGSSLQFIGATLVPLTQRGQYEEKTVHVETDSGEVFELKTLLCRV